MTITLQDISKETTKNPQYEQMNERLIKRAFDPKSLVVVDGGTVEKRVYSFCSVNESALRNTSVVGWMARCPETKTNEREREGGGLVWFSLVWFGLVRVEPIHCHDFR